MKVKNCLLALVLLASSLFFGEAKAVRPMIQCEACSSLNQMKAVAVERGQGEYFVFSLSHGLVLRFIIEYDYETQGYFVRSPQPGATMEEAFALMLDANALVPGIFAGQQVLTGEINRIGGGDHDPVAISIGGTHDDAYGRFIYDAKVCLGAQACAASVNAALGKIVGADRVLNGIGLSIRGTGGNISWENPPPNYELWLCNDNNDCALLKYENNDWKYIESRAEGGRGKRYPKYGESLNYNFANSGEAGVFTRGLRDAGAHVSGGYSTTTFLACSSSGGTMYCEYVTVPD
jgi:hypothetical protein